MGAPAICHSRPAAWASSALFQGSLALRQKARPACGRHRTYGPVHIIGLRVQKPWGASEDVHTPESLAAVCCPGVWWQLFTGVSEHGIRAIY